MSRTVEPVIIRSWRKSSFSEGANGCVELAIAEAVEGTPLWHREEDGKLCLVRDSKNPQGPVLAFRPSAWGAFIGGIKGGWADHLG
ncbi:hypothetical protein Sme01_25660 [Sphaerisporangium melleum]|uniref:DUF397 domain-containing protein n=1 Tax=Sphaerisporangium melleum TaxID=321316 RepID=A0A917VD48_9ACTN|nr:DUF397 domain-containing protein [Sphaerisporangium melleum]GGK64374.1 hypothetical protein GCM10007964_04280 [Sphaerisporangium melleum]GII70090.1 hypothetical protein Sme01_25660 [Sphaerisporangium melleum]